MIKKILDNLFFGLTGLIGLSGIIFSLTNRWLSFYNFQPEKEFLIIIGLLSALLVAVGYERWKQREETEKKVQKLSDDFGKLQSAFLQVPRFEIIEGSRNIKEETIKEVNHVERNIRATNFKNSEIIEDTPVTYYLALGQQIQLKTDKLIYECCFNEGNSFEERKIAFNSLNFADKDFDRMTYYQFQKQFYFNLLIIDDSVVFIGFPVHTLDRHMQTALKIKADNNKIAKDFIKSLIHWYDNVLKIRGELVDTKKLLKGK